MEPVAIVSQVGFPIGAFLLMWRLHRDTLTSLEDAIREQGQEFRQLREEVTE